MNSFITYTNFTGSTNIPIPNGSVTDFETDYIVPYQKEIIIKALGYDLYLALETGLAITPIEDIEQKWLDLKNGSNYTVDSKIKYNPGLIKIVTNYVYCKWVTINYEQLVGVGNGMSNSDNTTIISPENKITNAWNEMIVLYYQLYDFIKENETDYPNLNTEELRLLTYGF